MAKKQTDLNQTQENQLSLRSCRLCLHLYLKKNIISQVKVKQQLPTKLVGTLCPQRHFPRFYFFKTKKANPSIHHSRLLTVMATYGI